MVINYYSKGSIQYLNFIITTIEDITTITRDIITIKSIINIVIFKEVHSNIVIITITKKAIGNSNIMD